MRKLNTDSAAGVVDAPEILQIPGDLFRRQTTTAAMTVQFVHPGSTVQPRLAAPTPNEINDLTHKKSNYVVARFGFFSYFYLVIRVIQ